jgi:membrane associated rhomboid family serine protease
MATILQDIKYEFSRGNAIVKLAMINIAIYLIVNLVSVPIFLSGIKYQLYLEFLQEWLYLPSDPLKLLTRPWTLISYQFMHSGLWHLVFNMLVLWGFGRITNDLIHNSKIVPIYLMSGFAGALFFMVSFNVFPVFSRFGSVPMVGASASVMGMLLSAATLNPKGNIRLILIGNVQLQYVAMVLVLIDLISISPNNPGGHIAHLGGAAMGWFYIYLLRRGREIGQPIIFLGKTFQNIFSKSPKKPSPKRQAKMVVYKKTHSSAAQDPENKNDAYKSFSRNFAQKYRNLSPEECIDAILDRINRDGYEALTEEEKDFLQKSSKKK